LKNEQLGKDIGQEFLKRKGNEAWKAIVAGRAATGPKRMILS